MADQMKIAIVGAGATSLDAAKALKKTYPVIVFDSDTAKKELFESAQIPFTDLPDDLANAGILLITGSKRPVYAVDRLREICSIVGSHMKKGAVLIFESPVYPGTTEDICIPVLERHSGFTAGKEFFVGFAPARWNSNEAFPDKVKMRKVVVGQTKPVTDYLAELFEPIHDGGIFKAKTIRVAEAAQLLEIAQKEVNTALINELALSLNQQNIDTFDVLETANTKRGFVKFEPDLLGTPPDYWPQQAKWRPQAVGYGRELAQRIVKKLIQNEIIIHQCRVTVLGMLRNSPDEPESGLVQLVKELSDYGIDVQVSDEALANQGIECINGLILTSEKELKPAAAVILAVPHAAYLDMGWKLFERLLKDREGYVFDLNSVLPRSEKPEMVNLWRI